MGKIICFIAADILAIIYFLWPLDIVPDIIPVVGFIDDLIAVLIAAVGTIKAIRDHLKKAMQKDE